MTTYWQDLAVKLQDASTQDEFPNALLARVRDTEDLIMRAALASWPTNSDQARQLIVDVEALIGRLNDEHARLKAIYG